jgi:hypothetical protein
MQQLTRAGPYAKRRYLTAVHSIERMSRRNKDQFSPFPGILKLDAVDAVDAVQSLLFNVETLKQYKVDNGHRQKPRC